MLTHQSFPSGRQRGAVLFFAIVVLVATTLAGVALTRSVDTGNIIAGNLAFQQTTVNAADAGIEQAIDWLERNNRSLSTSAMADSVGCPTSDERLWCNLRSQGYSSVVLDPEPNQSWDAFWRNVLATPAPNGQTISLPRDAAGNRVSYTIQRLCTVADDPGNVIIIGTPQTCAHPPVDKAKGKSKGGSPSLKVKVRSQVYYRVTVRIEGPRNTLSYVQTLVAM